MRRTQSVGGESAGSCRSYDYGEPNFFTSVDTRRNILLLEASRKVIGAPDIALAMRKHVWRVFALGWASKSKGASDRRSSGPAQVVKYGAGWYQRISRVRACTLQSPTQE